ASPPHPPRSLPTRADRLRPSRSPSRTPPRARRLLPRLPVLPGCRALNCTTTAAPVPPGLGTRVTIYRGAHTADLVGAPAVSYCCAMMATCSFFEGVQPEDVEAALATLDRRRIPAEPVNVVLCHRPPEIY